MNFLVIVLSSQLLYYLLIAQTGVVGAFDSHMHDIFTLPIGGVIGSLMSAYWRHHALKQELYFIFGIQMIISWYYPNYSLGLLLVLGFVVGYTTPLLLHIFGTQSRLQLALGLAISYAIGTAFYTYPYVQRDDIAILLPMISVMALRFSHLGKTLFVKPVPLPLKTIAVMMLWIFADSALFETLSRSEHLDIWSHYTLIIILSHLLGVYLAYRNGKTLLENNGIIWGLFVLSYGLYYAGEGLWLAVIYPVAISYYNVLLFQTLVQTHDIRVIGIAMVGIGWMAASAANLIALNQLFWIAGAIVLIAVFILPLTKKGVAS